MYTIAVGALQIRPGSNAADVVAWHEQRCEFQPHQDIYNELLQAPGAKVTFVFINNILLAAAAAAAASADADTWHFLMIWYIRWVSVTWIYPFFLPLIIYIVCEKNPHSFRWLSDKNTNLKEHFVAEVSIIGWFVVAFFVIADDTALVVVVVHDTASTAAAVTNQALLT